MANFKPISQLLEDYQDGYSLEQEFYKNPDIYHKEIENIFLRHWLFAGHTSQIPKTGDYFLCEFDNESIIVIRTKDGSIKAHLNVCRHRGSHICLEKQGTAKSLTCPYHAWTY
ncbi:MAG: Rieske (2Fe-2S) protein, partial [Emcibacteraceae bacterium]|nr:Rieske (2Fe-2S) protein [Emcibacteraceae bacterium]